jgi:hypothetical protein
MPNIREYAGANFIKFDDLQDGPLEEQIAAVNQENGQFGKRLVLAFETGRQLSLNKTSVTGLMLDLGPDSDDWIGHTVEVYAGQIKYQGVMKDAVRVRVTGLDKSEPEPRRALVERSPAKPVDAQSGGGVRRSGANMDDEIPFAPERR